MENKNKEQTTTQDKKIYVDSEDLINPSQNKQRCLNPKCNKYVITLYDGLCLECSKTFKECQNIRIEDLKQKLKISFQNL
jgi:hypothetical protein